MPIITTIKPATPTTPTSQTTQTFTTGTVTINATFPTPMSNTNYVPTFSIGSGIALPAITITNKTINGYTATFLAVTSGTITANVIGT